MSATARIPGGAAAAPGRSVLAFAAPLLTLAGSAAASAGPDIVVSRVGDTSQVIARPDYAAYGVSGRLAAYSAATTACNVGDAPAEWIAGESGLHPVIAQNMYRLHEGRFEQVGMSWLKHSFCAGNEFTCGTCQPTACPSLGIGCADTYWATLNGDWMTLGPRSQVNPQAMAPQPTHTDWGPEPTGPDQIRGRLQVPLADIVPGALYVIEAHYITHDEAAPQRHNNATWRPVALAKDDIVSIGTGHVGEPAILAWAHFDPSVQVAIADLPDGGRFHLAFKTTDLGDGTWQYEYALHNLNAARAAGSFSVPLPRGGAVTSVGFHDVAYHSGEGFASEDWTASVGKNAVTWSCVPHASNPSANALRYSTLYNFRFRAAAPPAARTVSIGLFAPGSPASIAVAAVGPAPVCPADVDGNMTIDVADLVAVIMAWSTADRRADVSGDGIVDVRDLMLVILNFGACPR